MAYNSTYGNYTHPFGVAFNSMKVRYQDYDHSIESLNFVSPSDSVNVFISLESVLNYLSLIQDIDNKLLLERNFPTIFESEIINLCAHYKRFFRGNGLPTKVFIYYTDLESEEFTEYKYNEDYRSYYCNKYLRNPKFQLMGNKLIKPIIPRVKTIMDFIPDVYFISATGIEGSLVPWIISKEYPGSKNFIITTDKYDTQYMCYPKDFCVHFLKRSASGAQMYTKLDNYVGDMFKEEEHENNPTVKMYYNPAFYSLILSALGDKNRSIYSLKGIGCKTVSKFLTSGISTGKITAATTSIQLLKEVFPEEQHEELTNNFRYINLEAHYTELNEDQIHSIKSQIIDRSDYNSLIQLNQADYKDFPLRLEELTG